MSDIAGNIMNKITSKITAKRTAKKEPILLRDILPKVMRDIRQQIATKKQLQFEATTDNYNPGRTLAVKARANTCSKSQGEHLQQEPGRTPAAKTRANTDNKDQGEHRQQRPGRTPAAKTRANTGSKGQGKRRQQRCPGQIPATRIRAKATIGK